MKEREDMRQEQNALLKENAELRSLIERKDERIYETECDLTAIKQANETVEAVLSIEDQVSSHFQSSRRHLCRVGLAQKGNFLGS